MSSNAQAIWFFIAIIGCLVESIVGYWGPVANRGRFLGFRPGWLGLAAFIFVFFWIAMEAS